MDFKKSVGVRCVKEVKNVTETTNKECREKLIVEENKLYFGAPNEFSSLYSLWLRERLSIEFFMWSESKNSGRYFVIGIYLYIFTLHIH